MARAADPEIARREALAVVRALRDAGHTAYFAGGCVRDELLGLHPTDYDVATDAPPDKVKALFRRTHEVGAAFGVMLVPRPGATIEVATFRREGVYSDKRRPDSVTFTTAEEDARRRDFTINALFLDPLAASLPLPKPLPTIAGRVIDHVGGLNDLAGRMIRAVGDANRRLDEDHLRALRAVRFTARLGFTLDPATAAAIKAHATQLAGVSRERIGEEVRRMLEHGSRPKAVGLLAELGLDAPVLMEGHLDHSVAVLSAIPPEATFAVAMAAWALDRQAVGQTFIREGLAQGLVSRWRRALCLSNDHRDLLAAVLDQHRALRQADAAWSNLSVAAQKRSAMRAGFPEALTILRAQDATAATGVDLLLRSLGIDLTQPPPEPFLSGDDLIGVGMSPSPQFRRILDQVYDAQLEGRISGKREAVELARRLSI
jgi:tRNA nucleotidyltransferase/poly(A) polymerase